MADTSASASHLFAQMNTDHNTASDLRRQLQTEKATATKQLALLEQ